MHLPRTICLFSAFSFCFLSLHAQIDTSVHYQRDSVIDVQADCTTSFFQRCERVETPAKTMLVLRNGKTISMASFLKNNTSGVTADYGIIDLDGDSKKELVIYNYTGGAHCCDGIYIFKSTGPSKYQQTALLYAGNTCITSDNNFVYDFYESFGYFFTCYACGYEDTSETAPVHLDHITLRYNKGKMVVVPTDKELKSQINDNLGKLGEQPYGRIDDDLGQDHGERKEFALNLVVYYYSFGKNMVETQKLFNKYYKFPDAKKVWTAFAKEIQQLNKDNSF